jgi:hypothetical protein
MDNLQESITNLNEQMTALLAAIQPLLAGAAAAPGAAPAAAATAPAAVSFALSPGTTNPDQLIDYSTRTGQSLYDTGKSKLMDDEENKFDLKVTQVVRFQEMMQARCDIMGWSNPAQGITTYQVDGRNMNLISEYGQIPYDDLKLQSQAYWKHDGAKKRERAAQNNEMMTKCILSSLTESARDQLLVAKHSWMLSDEDPANPTNVAVAALLYKEIMRLTTLDTRATNKALRDNLKALPEFCVQVKGDVDKVNSYFMQNLNQLLARGEGADDKEDILFAAYQHVPDAEFRKYMSQKKDDYYDNINDMANADYRTIMLKAKTKYDMLMANKDRPFGSPSDEEQQVIALKAELEQFKDSNFKLSKQLKSKLKTSTSGNTQRASTASSTPRTSNQSTTRNPKNNSNRRRQKEDETWKKTAPKAGESKTIKKDNKTWHWCIHHIAWCLHSSDECRKGKSQGTPSVSRQQSGHENEQAGSKTSLNRQLLAHLAELSIQDE